VTRDQLKPADAGLKARAVNDGQKKRGTVEAVLEIAARLDRAADAKAAALVTGGGVGSAASTVYELRAFARELRELVEEVGR